MTGSQISRSLDIHRTVALQEQLVNAMGDQGNSWRTGGAECHRLMSQRRRTTRLCRMHEMILVLMFHV